MTNITIVEESIHLRDDGKAVTTSKHVADTFGKIHKNVLRDIKALDCSKKYHELNFEPMLIDVKAGQGAIRQVPAYELTKDGFMFLVMGYTGAKAARLKELWIEAFNRMNTLIYIQNENYTYVQEMLHQAREANEKLTAKILKEVPYWGAIKRYKDLDLSNNEVSRIIGKSRAFVSKTLKRMKALGITPASQAMALATTKMLLDSQRRITDLYRKELPGQYKKMLKLSHGNSTEGTDGAAPAMA